MVRAKKPAQQGMPTEKQAKPVNPTGPVPEDRAGPVVRKRTGQGSTAARKAKAKTAAKRQARGRKTGRAAASAKASALSVGDVELDGQVAAAMMAYDRACGTPSKWTEAEKREKTMAALMGNLQESLTVRQLRGSLVKREEVRAAVESMIALLVEKGGTFGNDLVARGELAELNAKQRRDVAKAASVLFSGVLELAREEALARAHRPA